MTLGRGCSFFVHPLAHERLMWSFALRTADESQLTQCPAGELLQGVAAVTRKWHEPIPTLVAETPEADVDIRPLFDVPPPTRARVARVCFAGDASHAMTPYRGRGANLAMMDALELATRLAEPNVSVDSALEAYELAMLPRNRRPLALKHAASQTLHPTSRAGVLLRNVRLRAAPLRAR